MFINGTPYILNFFDCCGFSTEYFHTAKYRQFCNFVFVVHILLAVFLSVCIIRIKQYLYAEHSSLDAFNETTQYIALLISYWIILLESRAHRKRQTIFWQLFRSCGHSVNEDCDFSLTVAEYLVGSIIVNGIAIYWPIVPRDL